MSFVKKALKKVWNFVKKNWKTIVLVAAIAFTAGVATIGFGAFAGVTGPATFLQAVGSTMWAGVAGTAGSMGIGPGAAVPAGSVLAEAGVTHVGLGAAWGAGGGYGFGAAGKTAAAQALTGSTSNAYGMAYEKALAKGLTEEAAKEAGYAAAKTSAAEFTGAGTEVLTKGGEMVAKTGLTGAKTGLTLEKAMMYAAIGGPFLSALGDEEPLNQYNTDADFHAVGGYSGPGRNFLIDPAATPDGSEGAGGPGGGTSAANDMFQNQMARPVASAFRPLMGRGVTGRGVDGRLEPEQNMGLMPAGAYG